MSNRVFLDSSLLIEYRKGTKTDLFEAIMADGDWQPCIGQVVVSEYLFFHLAIFSGKAPLTVKTAGEIGGVLTAHPPEDFLARFHWLPDAPSLIPVAVSLMRNYNLLPNDALIVALCKSHGVRHLASFDSDYEQVCHAEKITLIRSVHDL